LDYHQDIQLEEDHVELPELTQVFAQQHSDETFKGVNWIGKSVVKVSDEAFIYIYDPNNDGGKVVNILKGHDNHVNVVAVHQEKKILATSGIDSYAKLWESIEFIGIDTDSIEDLHCIGMSRIINILFSNVNFSFLIIQDLY
jgi:WD40 repeat protein